MKKILSILLTLIMLMGCMCIGVSAGGSAANEPAERPSDYVFTRIEIPGGAKEITLGDDTYNVIRTLGELQSITADGKYVLANDIDFGGKVIFGKLFSESWNGVFDGNGFTFKNFLVVGMADGCGLFLADSGADITVRNLNIGSASELIGFGASNNKMSGLICGKVGANAKLTVENVNIYATVSGGWQTGGFVGRGDAGCTIALNNCTMNGSVSSTVGKTGGFIGDNDGSSTFINCVNNADVSASYQNNGGFIGLSNKSTATITINGCVQNGNVTSTNATYGAGGFIGKAWSKVLISNSRFEGALSVTAEDSTSLSGEYMGHSCSNLSLALPLGVTNISRDLVGQYAAYTLIPQNTIAVKTAEDLKAMKGNGWYRLESDLTLTEAVEIIGGDISGVTLDLNGKTLTGELVVKDGTVVIGNGTLRSSDIGYAVTAKGESTLILDGKAKVVGNKGVCVSESSRIILKNADISVVNIAAACENSTAYAELTIKGAKLKVTGGAASDCAVKWNSSAILCVESGTVTADGNGIGIQYNKGNVEIKGGVIGGKYALALDGASGSALTVSGGELRGTAAAVYDMGNDGDVRIVGGLIKGTADGAFAAESGFSGSVKVLGGNFDEAVPKEYLQKGEYISELDKNSETYYVIAHTHTYEGGRYEQFDIGSHNKFCTICGESVREAHVWSDYISDGDTHYRECSLCGRTSMHLKHTEELDEAGNTVCPICNDVIVEAEKPADTAASTEESSKAEENGGCSSVVSGGFAVVLVIMALTAFFVKKRVGAE